MSKAVRIGEIVDNDAIEIGQLYQKAGHSLVDSVKYQIECGQRLTAKKATTRHGQWLPWLDSNLGVLGFSARTTATRLMKVAKANNASTHHLETSEALQISRQAWGNNTTRGTTGTGENEWYTPTEYIDLAREVLDGIDLDPASSDKAQDRVEAIGYYTLDNDGLAHEWHGRIWLNPPYAQPHIANFVSKLVAERSAGHIAAAIMLTHNYTDTSWFHEAMEEAAAVCFTRGRIAFEDAEGNKAAPTQGQAFFYFGDDVETFTLHFQEIGFVVVPA